MTMSIIAFALMAVVAMAFGFATMNLNLDVRIPELTQTGDSSLGRHSVNWLGATAVFFVAFICFALR